MSAPVDAPLQASAFKEAPTFRDEHLAAGQAAKSTGEAAAAVAPSRLVDAVASTPDIEPTEPVTTSLPPASAAALRLSNQVAASPTPKQAQASPAPNQAQAVTPKRSARSAEPPASAGSVSPSALVMPRPQQSLAAGSPIAAARSQLSSLSATPNRTQAPSGVAPLRVPKAFAPALKPATPQPKFESPTEPLLRRRKVADEAEEPDPWEHASILRNRRCSTVLWQDNDISREDAIARAEADPQCIGLMVCKTAAWTKDKRKKGERGWYQGAGGSLGNIRNDQWDTIVKPNKVEPPAPEPEPEPELEQPSTPPPRAYIQFLGYYMDDAGHTMEPSAHFTDVDAALKKLLQKMRDKEETVGFMGLQAASDGQATHVFVSVGPDETYKRIGKGGLRGPFVDVTLTSDVVGRFKEQGGAWCNAVYRISFTKPAPPPSPPPPPPVEVVPPEPTTREKATETSQAVGAALLLATPALAGPALEAISALQHAVSKVFDAVQELGFELPEGEEEQAPPFLPPSPPSPLMPLGAEPAMLSKAAAPFALFSLDSLEDFSGACMAFALMLSLLVAAVISHISDERPQANFVEDVRSVPALVRSVARSVWQSLLTISTAWLGLFGGLFSFLGGLVLLAGASVRCCGTLPLQPALRHPASWLSRLGAQCDRASAWIMEHLLSNATEEGLAEAGDHGLTTIDRQLFGVLEPSMRERSRAHLSAFVLCNACVLFLNWAVGALGLIGLLVSTGQALVGLMLPSEDSPHGGAALFAAAYTLANNTLRSLPLLAGFQEALLFAQLWYVIFVTGLFSESRAKGQSLDGGVLLIGLCVLGSAFEHLGVEPGWLELLPNFFSAKLDGGFAWLGLCEVSALVAAVGIVAHKRYSPRPVPEQPYIDPWETAPLLKARRCTKMLWQESNISREEAIARAEADPECIALMFSTRNARTREGRTPGMRGWYQGGGGRVSNVPNYDWDTILKPFEEELPPGSPRSPRASPRSGASPLPQAARATSLVGLGPRGEPLMFGSGFEDAKKESQGTPQAVALRRGDFSKKLDMV